MNFAFIEQKWQKVWSSSDYFTAKDFSDKPKYYVLEMFPYPSGKIHVGHIRNYSIGDVVARFKRQNGYNVLYPMGWDAFGLPAENAAIANNVLPRRWTYDNISNMKNQLKRFGFSYDWSREFITCDKDYYKHEQSFFIDLFKRGIAYQKLSKVNWDPVDKTVLANEQVIDGRGWRSGALVEQVYLKQWFLKITDYADRLLDDIDTLTNWPEHVKNAQKNWIGKSEGIKFSMKIELTCGEINSKKLSTSPNIEVYSTRPETIFGASFIAVACNHKILSELKDEINLSEKIGEQTENFNKIIEHNQIDIPKNATKHNETETYNKVGAHNKQVNDDNKGNSSELIDTQTKVTLYEKIENFCKKYNNYSRTEIEMMQKDGIFTGLYAICPFNENKKIPIFVVNFVLLDYGSGAIFGCPAHDSRDHEFAKLFNLDIIEVIKPKTDSINDETDNTFCLKNQPYTGDGIVINSDFLNELESQEAKKVVISKIEELGIGKRSTNYKLRDWGVSRQRYWGCPIPIIYCNVCGTVPVSLEDLPVCLPEDVKITGIGGNPLLEAKDWINVKCPKCGENAKRETDTFDTFFESSWYFFRYCNNNFDSIVDKKSAHYWMPVDLYIGGSEHAILHLLYSRFFTKLLFDYELSDVKEPFSKLLTQGMVLHKTYKDENGNWVYPNDVIEDESGNLCSNKSGKKISAGPIEKMSKSKKNIIDVDEIILKYGADAARLFILSDNPPENDFEWSDRGLNGAQKFIKKLLSFSESLSQTNNSIDSTSLNSASLDHESHDSESLKLSNISKDVLYNVHYAIKSVTECINLMAFNRGIAELRTLFNFLCKQEVITDIKYGFEILIRLIYPFTPHIAEEMWQKIGGKRNVFCLSWPEYNEKYLFLTKYTLAIQVCGKLRDTLEVSSDISNEEIEHLVVNLPKINKYICNKEIKKIIIVPKKLVNIVVL